MQQDLTLPDGAIRIPIHRSRDGIARAYAIVDAADAAWVSQWRWGLDSDGYARRAKRVDGRDRYVYLHREIMGLPLWERGGPECDHIDRDKLNCRRSNLRVVAGGRNQQNQASARGSSSRYRGVSWHRREGRWQAYVRVSGRLLHLGSFDNEEDAGAAAKAARLRLMPYAVD